ncbi:MAG TPA: 2OG-Fe(II) oxygenase [Magnetospirillaceae bacterium]|nr:2OG-Fe(II) oxygenase [Magnetospirillaceae bacterium]
MLAQLPQDWQNWVLENVQRGCNPADIIKQLVEHRVVAPAAAAAAIREASDKLSKPLETRSLPELQFDGDAAEIDGHRLRRSVWLESPRVAVIEDMLSPGECAAFIELGKEQLRAITVVDPDSGGDVVHEARRGRFTSFTRGQTDLIARIEDRIAKLIRWPVENGEGFQLIHYGPGDEYRAHYDWFDPALSGSAVHMKAGGQRVATIIFYLNRPERGGGTQFPWLSGLTVAAVPGRAVYFDNIDGAHAIDQRVQHAGTPVEAGEKWIVTKWLRVGPNVG